MRTVDFWQNVLDCYKAPSALAPSPEFYSKMLSYYACLAVLVLNAASGLAAPPTVNIKNGTVVGLDIPQFKQQGEYSYVGIYPLVRTYLILWVQSLLRHSIRSTTYVSSRFC